MEVLKDDEEIRGLAPLQREIEFFNELLPILLETDYGRWALIHGQDFGGTFESEGSAIDSGHRRYGNVPFLTRQVLKEQPKISFYGGGLLRHM